MTRVGNLRYSEFADLLATHNAFLRLPRCRGYDSLDNTGVPLWIAGALGMFDSQAERAYRHVTKFL